MEQLISGLKGALKNVINLLDDFLRGFDKTYKNEVKELENTKNKYQNEILDSKEELKKLGKKREKAEIDCEKLVRDEEEKIRVSKENTARIIKQENDRLDKRDREFKEKEKNHDDTERDIKARDNESKDREEKSKTLLSKSEKKDKELSDKIKEYDEKLSTLQKNQSKVTNDNIKTGKLLTDLEIQKKSSNELEQKRIQMVNALTEKGNDLNAKEKSLNDKEATQEKRQIEQDSRAKILNKQDENLKEEQNKITIMRSSLQQGHNNIKKLEQELNEKLKRK